MDKFDYEKEYARVDQIGREAFYSGADAAFAHVKKDDEKFCLKEWKCKRYSMGSGYHACAGQFFHMCAGYFIHKESTRCHCPELREEIMELSNEEKLANKLFERITIEENPLKEVIFSLKATGLKLVEDPDAQK